MKKIAMNERIVLKRMKQPLKQNQSSFYCPFGSSVSTVQARLEFIFLNRLHSNYTL